MAKKPAEKKAKAELKSLPSLKSYPKVSFLIPVFNEEKHVGNMLRTLQEQDYPLDRIEVIIADGKSGDGTVKAIREFQRHTKGCPLVKLVENPSRNTAVGRNICLKQATGKYIFNYSGHAYAEKNFVHTLVTKLEHAPGDVAAYGVSSNPPDEDLTFTGKCIQACFSTLIGGKGLVDQNIHMDEEKQVRSVAFSAYRREIFDEVGNFDEDLWCGQDGEFNLRINQAGKRIMYTPDSRVSLQKHDTPSRFFSQMHKYGLGAALRIRKHPKSFRVYYLLPAVGAALAIILFLISLFSRSVGDFFWSLIALYILIGIIWAFVQSQDILISLAAPFFYFIIHFAYGVGYLDGWLGKKGFKK